MAETREVAVSNRILALSLVCIMSIAGGLIEHAAGAVKELKDIPLQWTPKANIARMGPLDLSGALLNARIHIDSLTDVRPDASAVGENREKPAPRPVTTSSDVPAFVAEHMKETMHELGLNIVDGPGDVTIEGELREFFVTETSNYEGDLKMLLRVRNAAGQELWSGVVLGTAENFGRSYKAYNYYETMSDMVLNSTYNFLANPGFHEAFGKH